MNCSLILYYLSIPVDPITQACLSRVQLLHAHRRIRSPYRTQCPNKQANGNGIRTLCRLRRGLLSILRPLLVQLRALSWLQYTENNHTDERTNELGQRSEQVQNSQVNACCFAGRGVGGSVLDLAVKVVKTEEGWRGCWGKAGVGGIGKATVRGAIGKDSVGGCETVDFDPNECKRGPGGERPGSVVSKLI